MAESTRVRIEITGRLVEITEPGRTAEELAALARDLWPLTAPPDRTPMGFPGAGVGGSHERRPSPTVGHADQQHGPHRRHRVGDPTA